MYAARQVPNTAVRSLRYMARFRCLAGDCEATCCGGWGIAVEPSAHRRLKVLAQGDPALDELVERGIELTPNGPDYARLRFLPSGGCSMLDAEGLCSIHARFGSEALFDVCATYPRYASEIDGQLELAGTLSCPEVARLALLADDAFEITAIDTEAPRKLRNRFDTKRPYFRPFRLVRAAMLQLLARPGNTLREKLFALLWLGDQLRPVLYSGCDNVRDADVKALFDALPSVVGSLAASFHALDIDGSLPLLILHSALRPGSNASHEPRFDAIVREVWGAYGLSDTDAPSEAGLPAVWERYVDRCTSVPDWAQARLELCLTRYAQNHLLTTPYMLSENLFEYVYDLVVRLATLRFLLQTKLADFSGDAAELDRQIVLVTFTFSRAVEHADLPRRLQGMLAAQGLGSLAHAVCFLAV